MLKSLLMWAYMVPSAEKEVIWWWTLGFDFLSPLLSLTSIHMYGKAPVGYLRKLLVGPSLLYINWATCMGKDKVLNLNQKSWNFVGLHWQYPTVCYTVGGTRQTMVLLGIQLGFQGHTRCFPLKSVYLSSNRQINGKILAGWLFWRHY